MHCARDVGKKLSPEALGNFLFNISSNDLHASGYPSNAHQPALQGTPLQEKESTTAVALHTVPAAAAALMPQTNKKRQPKKSQSVPGQTGIDGKIFPASLHPKLGSEF